MGNEADYFLFPKLDVENRSAKPLSTPLRIKTAYNSVDGLWTALRRQSNRKLTRIDKYAPQELKATYRAYVREFMKSQDAEDQADALHWGLSKVPDLDALLDDSKMRKIAERRRRAQVMFRSSIMNEERTKILLHNNPLPIMNNDDQSDDNDGGAGIMRFMLPSAEAAPKKHLVTVSDGDNDDDDDDYNNNNDRIAEDSSRSESNAEESETSTDSARSDPAPEVPDHDPGLRFRDKAKPFRCVFLTEADASTLGTFSRKRRELMDAKATDKQYAQKQGTSQELALIPMSHRRIQAACSSKKKVAEKKSAEVGAKYQPLTLGALMEYGMKCSAPGEGSFKFGARPMWTVQ